MDEVTIFGLNYFKEHYPEELTARFKQLDLSQEALDMIMDMTQKLGFRDDYDRFYSLFVKDVRDDKLGRYCVKTYGCNRKKQARKLTNSCSSLWDNFRFATHVFKNSVHTA